MWETKNTENTQMLKHLTELINASTKIQELMNELKIIINKQCEL